MGISPRESLQKLLERKEQEIADLEIQVREARSYAEALRESIRLVSKGETQNGASEAPVPSLRPNSLLFQVREILLKHGKPMYIAELLAAVGRPVDHGNRVSLAGTLSSYAREGKIFRKTAPNTFGLLEFDLPHVSPPIEAAAMEET
jgi:hypothetical protein